jgi:hypothetical protein
LTVAEKMSDHPLFYNFEWMAEGSPQQSRDVHPGDFWNYDRMGPEQQQQLEDGPPGDFKNYVHRQQQRQTPKKKKTNWKSVGTMGCASVQDRGDFGSVLLQSSDHQISPPRIVKRSSLYQEGKISRN